MGNKEVQAKSLYAEYVKSREGFESVEEPYGFATYKITGKDCYIRDVYVLPQLRRQKAASDLCNKIKWIAKDVGCSTLITTVAPSANGSTDSLKAVLGYGFKLDSSQNDFIIFKIDI